MTELVMLLVRTKSDIVKALRLKALLWDKGVKPSGMVIKDNGKGAIPPGFLEDMMELEIVGFLT